MSNCVYRDTLNKTPMTINYIHIYDLLAGGPITGVRVYTRVHGEEGWKFNDIHSFLEPDMRVCTLLYTVLLGM